jgi:hypothetical protein
VPAAKARSLSAAIAIGAISTVPVSALFSPVWKNNVKLEHAINPALKDVIYMPDVNNSIANGKKKK